MPRRIAYLLDRPTLGGGVKVVFQHAALLGSLGHEVTVLGVGPRPSWVQEGVAYADYTGGLPELPAQDVVIATWWATLAVADSWGRGPVVHFCQGYEGDLAHLAPVWQDIERAYACRRISFAVTPYLVTLLHERFGREARVVSPPVDPRFRPRWRLGPRREPWVFVPGIFEAEVKGVATALEAVKRLRHLGVPARLVRLSVLPLSQAERDLLAPDLYLHAVDPAVVARELPRMDLLLFPSLAGEGFGLPLLEAMASGIPAVASRIPATEFIGGEELILTPPGDASALADAARTLLSNGRRWRAARRRGRRAARRFDGRAIAAQLAEAIEWAVGEVGPAG